MPLIVSILIQLVVLVVAMIIASLILRWIMANPEKCKAAWKNTKRRALTPFVWVRAARAYINWKRVKMKFTFTECKAREWEKYDEKHTPDQTYYRM